MNRRALAILGCLALGLGLNVLIATRAAWNADFSKPRLVRVLDTTWLWHWDAPEQSTPARNYKQQTPTWLLECRQFVEPPRVPVVVQLGMQNRWEDATQLRLRTGWPLFSMQARRWSNLYQQHDGRSETRRLDSGIFFLGFEGGLRVYRNGSSPGNTRWSAEPTWIPLEPRPLQSALNSIFYAALVYGCVLGVRSLRDRLRVKPGHCRKCRYELNDLPLCPECGTPNAAHARWNRPAIPPPASQAKS